MIALCWNCRGMGHLATIQYLRDLKNSHKPNVIFLSKLKCSIFFSKVNLLASRLGFSNFEFVPAVGKAGGLVPHVKRFCSIVYCFFLISMLSTLLLWIN